MRSLWDQKNKEGKKNQQRVIETKNELCFVIFIIFFNITEKEKNQRN